MSETISEPGTLFIDVEGNVYFLNGGIKSHKIGTTSDFKIPFEDGHDIEFDADVLAQLKAKQEELQKAQLTTLGITNPTPQDTNRMVRLYQVYNVLLQQEDDGENSVTAADSAVEP